MQTVITSSFFVVTDMGASGNGTDDDTAGFQRAIGQATAAGGGTIILPPGEYSIGTVTFPTGDAPITLVGQGDASVLKRRADLADGVGMLDILGSNVTLENLVIEGNVTTSVGLLYNADFATGESLNDPMAVSLTKNTSVWLHGGTRKFTCNRVTFRHTGGYAALIHADQAGIDDVRFLDCTFENNRPHLFGVVSGNAIYGSWSGGILVHGDGRGGAPGCVLRGLMVERCRFLRCTGNQIWSHLYGLEVLHEDFQICNNYFRDIGLDGVLIGGVTGGAVMGNVFRRIGYTTWGDGDVSVPRWLAGVNATAIDSSGLVKGVPYEGNSMLSINGGCLDLDGHGYSVISGNVCRTPYPGEPEYDEDQIAISGPNNDGPYSYGVNLGNTSQTAWGAVNVNISGNTFINLRAGAVRIFGGRRCLLSGNDIIAPDDSLYPPVLLGTLGVGANQRCFDNRISGNRFSYSPAVAAPCVSEDETISNFLGYEKNSVFSNNPISGNGNATEFRKAPHSGSVIYAPTVWFP